MNIIHVLFYLGKRVLIIIYVILFISGVVNIFDIKTPYLNPPYSSYSIHYSLQYPSASGVVLAMNDSSRTINVEMDVYYSGFLTDREPIKLEAKASVGASLVQEISSMSVGFEGTYPYSENNSYRSIGPPYTGVSFDMIKKASSMDLALGDNNFQGDSCEIMWQHPGEYRPHLVIIFKNFTYIDQAYDNYYIPVSSSDLYRQDRYNRVNTSMSIFLFIFGSNELLKLSQSWLKPKTDAKPVQSETKIVKEKLNTKGKGKKPLWKRFKP